MALRRRVTADGNGPDPVIVRRILVREPVGSDPLHVAIVNVLARENVATVIVIGIVRGMGKMEPDAQLTESFFNFEISTIVARDVLGHATKLRRQRRKPRRITPNATITMTVTDHRIVIANATAIVNAVRSIARGIKLSEIQPTELAFKRIICKRSNIIGTLSNFIIFFLLFVAKL